MDSIGLGKILFPRDDERASAAVCGHRACLNSPRGFCHSYRPYRHTALKLYLVLINAIFLINTNVYAQSVQLSRVGQNFRIKGPLSPVPMIQSSTTKAQGDGCEGKETIDLVLLFSEDLGPWIEGVSQLQTGAKVVQGPCRVMAGPTADGKTELRFSYLKQGKQSEMKTIIFKTNSNLVIDHWPEAQMQIKNKIAQKSFKKKSSAEILEKKLLNDLNLGPDVSVKATGTFEDLSTWEAMLGLSASVMDKNSPELDRYRAGILEHKPYIKLEVQRQALELPQLDFQSKDHELEFKEEQIDWEEFKELPIDSGKKMPSERNQSAVLKGMNFVQIFAKKSEWIKALEGIRILESSEFAKDVPALDPRWLALKGLVYVKFGEENKDKSFFQKGLNTWREGLQRTSGKVSSSKEYVEFMARQILRNLLLSKNAYAAASFLTWAEKFTWSPELNEKFAYFKGEALYDLGVFEDAKIVFTEFIENRINLPITSMSDRRLLPSAVFRLGDIQMRLGKFALAIEEYSKGMSRLGLSDKINFEGLLLPGDLKVFPHVLFNRSEAFFRVGKMSDALRDLRALIYLDPKVSWIGMIYYRLGDLLERIGAEKDQIESAWRECLFRVPKTMGGDLCRSRAAALKMMTGPKELWNRYMNDMEIPMRRESMEMLQEGILPNDLKIHINMLIANVFIKLNEPYQAFLRTYPLINLEASEFSMVWNLEYIHVSFIGYLKKLIIENKNKKVSSEFSKYRRELFLELVKPEALWMLAISYKNLELWNLAWESYQESVRISEIVKRVLPRPYDPTLEEKKYLKTEILVGGVGHHYPDWPNVLAELKKMDEKDPAVARLWIRYFDIKKEKDLSLYMLWWKVLFESDLLQEVEIVRYSKTLKTAGNKLLRSKVNEMKAGIWFSENLKKQNKVTAPSINLMWELFESRLDIKDFSGALRVLDYLKTLEAKFFEEPISLSQVYYEKGKILLIVNNKEEARQSFEQSKTLAPSSVYGKLSASELKAL